MTTKSLQVSPVYGPVRSWRYGNSLGIDPICEISTCSFNCVYCQLGDIQVVTSERREFIPTERLIEDLKRVDWSQVDVVTFSGSGEPTLATNLGAMIAHLKKTYRIPVHVLTNATLFHLPEVRRAVGEADVVSCKLDAGTEAMFQRVNRPAPGITLAGIVNNIRALRAEYRGRIELQVMFLPMNHGELEAMIPLIREIAPDEVQLNTPRRPYPLEWHVGTRGDASHDPSQIAWPTRRLAVISRQEAAAAEHRLREATGVKLVSVYRV